MSDILQKVQVLIGGNADQANKVIREVEENLKASQQRMKTNSAKVGKDTGDQFGKSFAKAQDSWLRFAEGSLKQYGGKVGRVIGEMIGQFDKLSKAREASRQLSEVNQGGRGGPSAIETAAATATGASLANGGGKALGRGVVAGIAGLQHNNNRSLALENARFLRSRQATLSRKLNPARYEDFKKNAMPGENVVQYLRRAQDGDGYLERLRQYDPQNVGEYERTTNLRRRNASLYKGSKSSLSFAGAATRLPLLGGLGVAGAVGLAGVGIAGISALAGKSKENAETRKEINEAKDLIKTIEDIKDPVERTKAIIEELGKDGQEQFRKLKDTTKELQDSLGSEGWQNAADKAAVAWQTIKDSFNSVVAPLAEGMGNVVNRIMSWWTGMSDEMVEESRRNEAIIERLTKKADKLRADKVEMEKAKAKEKETNDNRLKSGIDTEKAETESLLRDETSLLQQQKDLESITAALGEKKNRTLEEEFNYRKAINELIKVDNKLTDEATKNREKALDAAEKQAALDEKIADRSKLGVSELAGMNTPAGRAAAQVQQLEEQAKQARGAGNGGLADQLTGRANNMRGRLGAAGIIKSGEYGDEFPTGFGGTGGPLTAEELLQTGKRGFAYQQGQARQRISDAYIGQGAISKYGHRIGPVGKHLQEIAKRRADELAGRKSGKTMDQDYFEKGYVTVRAQNGK